MLLRRREKLWPWMLKDDDSEGIFLAIGPSQNKTPTAWAIILNSSNLLRMIILLYI